MGEVITGVFGCKKRVQRRNSEDILEEYLKALGAVEYQVLNSRSTNQKPVFLELLLYHIYGSAKCNCGGRPIILVAFEAGAVGRRWRSPRSSA